MRSETSMLAKDHFAYVGSNPEHTEKFRTFDTIYDHFYYYLTTVRGLLPDTARGIADDFEADLQKQKDDSLD